MNINLGKKKNDDEKENKRGPTGRPTKRGPFKEPAKRGPKSPEKSTNSTGSVLDLVKDKIPAVTDKLEFLTDRFSTRTLAIGGIIIAIIFISIVGRIFGGGGDDGDMDIAELPPQEETPVDVGKETEKPKDEPADEEPKETPIEDDDIPELQMDEVKNNLLNPDKSIENSQEAKEIVAEGFNHILSLAENGKMYQPKENKSMGSTNAFVVDDIIIAMEAGYRADVTKSEWTQGSVDFVYQFVIPFNSTTSPNAFLSGNYNTKNKDFQVVRLEGVDFSAVASPGEDIEGFEQGPSEEDIKRMEEEKENKK